jgi:hypothetical protein
LEGVWIRLSFKDRFLAPCQTLVGITIRNFFIAVSHLGLGLRLGPARYDASSARLVGLVGSKGTCAGDDDAALLCRLRRDVAPALQGSVRCHSGRSSSRAIQSSPSHCDQKVANRDTS